jgi:hypothetical protein
MFTSHHVAVSFGALYDRYINTHKINSKQSIMRKLKSSSAEFDGICSHVSKQIHILPKYSKILPVYSVLRSTIQSS